MTPATSVPGTWPTRRAATFQSTGLTAADRTLMSTSPAPGLGTSISCTDNFAPSPTCTPRIFSGAASAAAHIVSATAPNTVERMETSLLIDVYNRLISPPADTLLD